MLYRSMTLKELTEMLGADSRRLERMAQRGEIPCQKVGGQFRFNRAEITEWLQQQIGNLDDDHLAEVDAGMAAHNQSQQELAIVTPLLRREAVIPQLDSRTKTSTLRKLVTIAEATGLVYDSQALHEAVVHREELCTTAMESGIAIPHPRRPLPYEIADTLLVVAKADQGIIFGAPDGPTHLFFMIASQDDTHHLHLLARLCRMLRQPDLIGDLLQAETAEDMIKRMIACETTIIAMK